MKAKGEVTAPKGLLQLSCPAVENAESCVVCTTKLNSGAEPKLLPCLHIMCKGCIIITSVNKKAKECPKCGQSFNLSEVTDCLIFEDFTPKCGGCDESTLSGWCKECEEALCSECVSAHQRVKMTRDHTVIPQERQSGLGTSLCCTSHKQERLKFFCVNCDQLTCRDCQLFDHRNHSFLLLDEAVFSQKDKLMKLLDSIREQKNSVRAKLQDLDARLNDLKELKLLTEKQLHNALCSLYASLKSRCHQLSKDLEIFCHEEEKSLKVMKTSLKKLEDRQEYIAAFINKILSTEGQCILRHKVQIEKWAQRVASQKNLLPDTMVQLSFSLNEGMCQMIKNFGFLNVTRVPLTAKGRHNNGSKPKNTPKEADRCPSELNKESGATRPLSDTTSIQATTHSMSQAASDLPQCGQSKYAWSKSLQPAQVLTEPTIRSSSSSSISSNFAPLQTTQSNTAQNVVAQVGHHLSKSISLQQPQSQQVFRSRSDPLKSTSLLQSSSSVCGQTVLKIIPSNPSQHAIVMPQVVLPQPQPHVVYAAAVPTVAHPSVSSQSFYLNSSINTQSQFLSSNQSAPSVLTLTPLAQSNQAMSNTQPSNINSLSVHTQQSISQAVSNQLFPPQIASANKLHPPSQAATNAQSVNPQPSQSTSTKSKHSQFVLLNASNNNFSLNFGRTWKFCRYTPVLTVNNGNTLTCVPQPSHSKSANEAFSQASRFKGILVSSDQELDPVVSNQPQSTATSIQSVYGNAGQNKCATQTIQTRTCELPVKAPADSVCEVNIGVCSRASPVGDEADSNLPTSTVPEKNTQAKELAAVHQPQDSLSTTSVRDCPPNQSILTLNQSESPLRRILTLSSTGSSLTNHCTTGLPSFFKEIVCNNVKVPVEDTCSKSALELASLPNAKQNEDDKADDDHDDDDSNLVEGMVESEVKPILRPDSNKSLLVSLLRLPISGSSLSQFQVLSGSQKSEILLQEIDEHQSVKRCLRITAPPAVASTSHSCSSKCSLQAEVLDCAVCLSAGASLQCAECGRSFHISCHVPPILVDPVVMWVCTLCQDVMDDTDPFSYTRLKEPYLSLSDQRRCEQLLLTLMCENNCYLLYKTIKQNAGCVEFNLIVGRLLGKCSPPYRSAAEMVSDLWALFDNLFISEKKDLVIKLQSSFQRRLHELFGKCFHASLLRPLSGGDQMRAPETESDEETRSTLKRKGEFWDANCPVVAKKAHIENT